MTARSNHPAVFAGLMGSAALGVPRLAFASPLEDVAQAVGGSLLLQFVVGCALGAAVAGIISYIYDRKADAEEEAALESDEEYSENWSASSLNIMHAQEEAVEEDPTGDLGRFRTGQITIDLPTVGEEPAPEAAPAPRAQARGRGRHFAGAVAARQPVVQQPAPQPARRARHFAKPEKPEPLVASLLGIVDEKPASPSRGRHFAGSAASMPVARPRRAHAAHAKPAAQAAGAAEEQVGPKAEAPAAPMPEASVQPVSEPKSIEAAATADLQNPALVEPAAMGEKSGRARLANLPAIDDAASDEVVPVVPAASAEDVATAMRNGHASHVKASAEVTNRLTLRQRMAARTKSVRDVLSERLSPFAMDGVPIITRADGTVSDAVKKSWLDQTLAPVIASITGATPKISDTESRTIEVQEPSKAQPKAVRQTVSEDASRASYISRRVAEVNVGMFPERRSADELEGEDLWDEALAAMGEVIAQDTPIFQDVVGGPATIDDPDGLEGPTGFIPFRVPAAHPEVVDTDTYVDYLLREELSHNESQALRHSSHSYLRVIEGGTSPLRVRRRAGETGPMTRGRHFAGERFAQEA